MRKLLCLIISLLLVVPLFIACENTESVEDQSAENNKTDISVTVGFGNKEFKIDKLNCVPSGDEIVLYSKDYKLDGKYSLSVAPLAAGRTVISVRANMTDDGYEFDIVERTEDEKKAIIPFNGFAVSIPTSSLDGIRANVGQLVKVEGYESVRPDYERADLATIAPDYLVSTASRRVNLVDPKNGFVEDKIYYITDQFSGSKISCDNVVVSVKLTTNYSGEIISVEKKEHINKPTNGEVMFVFTGEYNVAYAKFYFTDAERITFSMLDKCNSYSDKSAFVIKSGVFEFNDKNLNIEGTLSDGVYVFTDDYSASVTPEVASKRKDVIIINGYVAKVGDEGARSLIPGGNGFVITLVGEDVINMADDFQIGNKIETCYIDFAEIPDKYVEIDGNYFAFDFQNGTRAPEGVSVVYTPEFGKTTGTNQYGSEIVISDGKVIAINKGRGDSEIPENGFVLSLHKDATDYPSIRKISVGDDASLGFGGSAYSISSLQINGINSVRNENTLIVYTGKTSTETNPYGYEIAIDKDGYAISDGYDGNMSIPDGGFVLSGHGINKTALENAYAVGQRVILDTKNKTVVLIKTPDHRLSAAQNSFAEVNDKITKAKKAFLNIDYKSLGEQTALMESLVKEAEEAFDKFDFEVALSKAESVISTCEKLQYSFYESNGVENRAVWYRSTETNDEQVLATVLKMKSLNVNALYLETWYEGYCIGSKIDVEGITAPSRQGTYDVLEGFIRIGHEHGIEVHAWVHNFFVGYYYKDGRNYYNPTFDNYKSKYLVDIKGRDYFYYTANNNYFIFLNANDRECRDLILEIYNRLITEYDLDGLHLDYVRMPELNYGTDDFGYNQDIIDAFAKETGITKDPRTFANNSPEKKAWIDFRCNIITSFVGEVYEMVRKNNPDIWISAATYPDLSMAKNDIFQDVRSFIEKGYLDEVFSMSYGVDNGSVMPSVKAYNSITEGKVFYSAGIAAFLETTDKNFAIQLDEVVRHGADGVSVFALASITPNAYQNPMTEGAFRSPSVQINKLSVTASAQMKYINSKIDNLSNVFEKLDSEDIDFIKDQCNEIKKFSDEIDIDNATVAQKLDWCNKAMSKIASAKANILNKCESNNETKAIISEFELLEYWLTISAKRLNTRK